MHRSVQTWVDARMVERGFVLVCSCEGARMYTSLSVCTFHLLCVPMRSGHYAHACGPLPSIAYAHNCDLREHSCNFQRLSFFSGADIGCGAMFVPDAIRRMALGPRHMYTLKSYPRRSGQSPMLPPRCRTVVQQLSKSCPGSQCLDQLRSKSAIWGRVGPVWATLW